MASFVTSAWYAPNTMLSLQTLELHVDVIKREVNGLICALYHLVVRAQNTSFYVDDIRQLKLIALDLHTYIAPTNMTQLTVES